MSINWKNVGKITESNQSFQLQRYNTWIIKHFGDLPSAVGGWHESPKFSISKLYECTLDLYVAGYDEVSSDYISIQIYLHNKDKHPNVKFNIECSILDENDTKKATKTAALTHETLNEPAGAIKYFILRKDLLGDPKLLPNDELRIICVISFDVNKETIDISSRKHEVGILEKLFCDKKFSDFEFLVGEKKFSVHRAILAAASPVFEAMFETNMRESSEGKVKIEDIEPKVMESLLRFIYVGQVNGIQDFTEKLLAAAEKYQLDSLKMLCENKIAEKLSMDSVYDILILADIFNACDLKNKAMEFFSENVERLYAKTDFKTAVSSLPGNLQIEIICSLADKLSAIKN